MYGGHGVQPMFRKDFERAIRDFKQVMQSILATDKMDTYETRVKEFVDLVETNHVLKTFMQPFIDIQIDIKEVVPGWREFKLPSDSNKQIAYMFKLFYTVHNENWRLANYLHDAFGERNVSMNYYKFNNVFVQNCYDKLLIMLQDFLDDQFEKPQKETAMVFNHYEIKDINNSNIVAGGSNNVQSINLGLSDKILIELINTCKLTQEQIDVIKPALKIIEQEHGKEKPDKGLLEAAWEKVYSIGGKIALQATINLITKPEVMQSGMTFIMGLLK